MKSDTDCAHQRLLSAQGERDAAALGTQILALRLPVGEAVASRYCRTMDPARLMLCDVTPRNEIREAKAGDCAGLKRLLTAPVAAGSNRWIVGHGIPFRSVAVPPHLAEGEGGDPARHHALDGRGPARGDGLACTGHCAVSGAALAGAEHPALG